MLKTNQQIPPILSTVKQGLTEIYGEKLDQIILYGSQARGDALQDSDIDILIVLKEPFTLFQENARISNFIADLCLEYSVLISCVLATKENYQHYDNAFFRNVRREGAIL